MRLFIRIYARIPIHSVTSSCVTRKVGDEFNRKYDFDVCQAEDIRHFAGPAPLGADPCIMGLSLRVQNVYYGTQTFLVRYSRISVKAITFGATCAPCILLLRVSSKSRFSHSNHEDIDFQPAKIVAAVFYWQERMTQAFGTLKIQKGDVILNL